MAISNFSNITFWQSVPAIGAIAAAKGSLITNATPDPDYQIGQVTQVVGGTMTASDVSTTVTRDGGPVFTANGSVGDNLVAYTGSEWINIGTVEEITDDEITLAAVAANSVTASAYAFANVPFRPMFGYLARVQTLAGGGPTTRKVPLLRALRSPVSGDPSVLADSSQVGIIQFSETNNPDGPIGSPSGVNCTIDRTTTFEPGSVPGTYFANSNQFPLYMWYYVAQTSNLLTNTRFDLLFLNTLEDYEITINTPAVYADKVASFGYF